MHPHFENPPFSPCLLFPILGLHLGYLSACQSLRSCIGLWGCNHSRSSTEPSRVKTQAPSLLLPPSQGSHLIHMIQDDFSPPRGKGGRPDPFLLRGDPDVASLLPLSVSHT